MTGCASFAAAPGNEPRTDAYVLRIEADAAYARRDYAVAEARYRELVQQVPNDAYGHFKLGNVLVQQGKLHEAGQAFEGTLQLDPGLAKAASNLATLYLIQAQQALHRAIDHLAANDPAAPLLMLREQQIRQIADIPVDERAAGGRAVLLAPRLGLP
jgi:Flp pilus assembly protein TadD